MESKWTGLRAEREKIQPTPGGYVQKAAREESEIADLKLCLTGNPASKRWRVLKAELDNRESSLLHMKRRLVGRTPQMESWADPLLG